MYRFLVSTRWVGWLALVCVFAAACWGLGNWQMNRLDQARAANQIVEQNYDAAPRPYADASGLLESLPREAEWTPVRMTGEYLAEDTIVARNRPLGGRPGYEVLVPFRTQAGDVVVVDRGWLPIGNDQAGRPDAIPAPPSGTVEAVVRVRPYEPELDRGAPDGQVASIERRAIERQLDYAVAPGAYGVIASETPAAEPMPAALEKPELDEGNHLSYSLQWFAFGVLGFVALVWAARQQARINREDREAAAEAEAAGVEVVHSAYRPPRRKPVRRRDGAPTDEELEDAYLDALEGSRRPPQ
ncbi:SURF1 family protein [Zhihengliuella sp.]|uniref:SURF1 family cytochrome oxidase biogenesis protein n=1 Tax=Zhihengliuella sp. TaxID=1954483 RepID=UPI00281221F6|nr:SURF1 family protein [Zhihengliuella sp.]